MSIFETKAASDLFRCPAFRDVAHDPLAQLWMTDQLALPGMAITGPGLRAMAK